jgi:uncharacterized phage-like protein YoqJ
VADGVRTRLTEILEAKKAMQPDAVVLTGLGLGAEQLGAQAAAAAGVPYVAVLAYPGQESVWPPDSQRTFAELMQGAERSIQLESRRPDSPQRFGAAMARRDDWMGAQADEAIVVWDGHDARLGRTVRSFQDRLGDDVWVVEPAG